MSTCLKNNRAFIQGVTSAPTDANIAAGDIYYNTTDDTMYRYSATGDWVPLGSGGKVTVSTSAPVDADTNDGWFDTGGTGLLYVYDGYSWVQILDPKDANTTSVGTTAPSGPVVGDFWVDTSNNNTLKLYDGTSWITVTTPPAALGALADITDITNSGSNGQVLTSNGNGTYTFTSATTELKLLTDITNPQPNQFLNANTLVFNGTDYGFVERVKQFQDLSDVEPYTGTLEKDVLQYDGDGTYSWVTNEHQLEDLTNVDGSTTAGHILVADGDGTYSFQQPAAGVTVSATAPTGLGNNSDDIGSLWFDNSDTDTAGLYIWSGTNWVSTNGGNTSSVNAVTLDSSAAGATTINSFTAFQEIKTSDYISDGETFEIPSDVWVWSDNTSVAALIIDTPNATVINNGKIIGRGGNGNGGAGGPAISVTAAGVTINNASGAYIAGGGGGGGTSIGGGGAGGGVGGSSGGAGGTLGSAGSNGTGFTSVFLSTYSNNFFTENGCPNSGVNALCSDTVSVTGTGGTGGNQGGGTGTTQSVSAYVTCRVPACDINDGGKTFAQAGYTPHTRNASGTATFGGGGGGRVLSATNSQGSGTYSGGAWGASGGGGGGAGGAAVSGSYTQGTWAGTVYGTS